jgi:ribose-phosphate pyrophosphokinase
VVADLLQVVGISHVVTVNLHTPQIEGFFHAPVDSLTAVPTLCRIVRDRVPADLVVVSPDVGRIGMATRYAEQCLGASLVVLHKRRVSGSETKVTRVVGDVSGRACLIVDDMISTGGTREHHSTPRPWRAARNHGGGHARAVCPRCAHQIEPPRRARSVCDRYRQVAKQNWPQVRVISIAPLIAGAVQRFLTNGALGKLY